MSNRFGLDHILQGLSALSLHPDSSNDDSSGNSMTTMETTTNITNILDIGTLEGFLDNIYNALYSHQPSLHVHLKAFEGKVDLVLYKLAFDHVAKKITPDGDLSLINEFIGHGEYLIYQAVDFAKYLENYHAEYFSSESDGVDEDLYLQIIRHSLHYYCGLTMLLGAFLFWSAVFPEIPISKQFDKTLGKISEASELYESLLKNTIKIKMNSDDDEKGGHIKADHKHLLEDSSVTMFKEITEGCKIIGTISDYLSKTSFLNQIFGVDDGNGSSECGGKYLGRCPQDLFDWAYDFQTTGYFSYDAIMNRVELYTFEASQKN
ncbi:hypothetical protein H4219_004622 [Mycoemilia scoparia]|uniref:Uncharacterized protein n=1 Tax=Mycoemilia scoparia TaxID=417184 RepID=A0A9W7ZVP4_9FUNG|nr:hypothetical protein H4219_004622 [Mycoemilia scoparia]